MLMMLKAKMCMLESSEKKNLKKKNAFVVSMNPALQCPKDTQTFGW